MQEEDFFDDWYNHLKDLFLSKLVSYVAQNSGKKISYYTAYKIAKKLKIDRKLIRSFLFDLCIEGFIEFNGNGEIVVKF